MGRIPMMLRQLASISLSRLAVAFTPGQTVFDPMLGIANLYVWNHSRRAHSTSGGFRGADKGLFSATGAARSQGRKAPWGHTTPIALNMRPFGPFD